MTDFKREIKELLDSANPGVIREFFKSEATNVGDCASDDYRDEDFSSFFSEMTGKDIDFENVDRHGGEGKGEDYWSVYKILQTR